MKQFDDKFRQQVADAFSNYDAGRLADTGWNSFVRKQKGRRYFGIIIPLWAKAASVAIILATGFLFTYRALDRKADTTLTGAAPLEESNVRPPATGIRTIPGEAAVIAGDDRAVKEIAESQISTISIIPAELSKTIVSGLTDEGWVVSYVTPEKPVLPDSLAAKHHIDTPPDKLIVAAGDDIPELLDESVIIDPVTAPGNKRTFLIAGFSGMMSVVNDMASGAPGVSLGIYSEHRLTRRLALRPGIVIARNTLGVESTSPSSNIGFATPALGGASGVLDSYEATMELLAMEVPVNLVFTVLDGEKSSLFLSAGTSTLIYINQHISGSFRNAYTKESMNTTDGQMSYETRYSEVDIETEQPPFSKTDYFGLANFSAGYSLPFGKSNNLLIEPFVQLPLSDLTSLNVRVRYGGVSMKLRFGLK